MNALAALTILSVFQFCCSNLTEAKIDGVNPSQNKTHREVEPYTTILLNDESFSIVSVGKHSNHKSKGSSNRRKESFNRIINNNLPIKANNERQHNAYKSLKIKPYYVIPKKHNYVPPNKLNYASGSSVGKDVAHSAKLLSAKHQGKVIKHPKEARSPKKKLQKRHFEKPIRYYRDKTREFKRNNVSKDFGPTYRYVLTEATNAPKSNLNNNQPKIFDHTSSLSNKDEFFENLNANPSSNKDDFFENLNASPSSNKEDFFENLNENPSENVERLTTRDHSMNVPRTVIFPRSPASTLSSPLNSKQDNVQLFNQNTGDYEDSRLYQNMPPNTNRNYKQSPIMRTVAGLPTTVPTIHAVGFQQADIVQRNLEAQKKKTAKDYSPEDESEFDDTVITFDEGCDRIENQTCLVQREVGDVLTLALKIKSSKKPSSFQIRWMKLYHKYDSNKGKPLELEPGKLPWNMVSGSEGRQLRLNPVSNSDTDPNCFIAQVFMVKKHHGKVLFTKLKKLIFRIEIPIIDMGKLYAGEEVSINIENFVSLPERGHLLFQWNLQRKPDEYESLPSNIKVSPSGRTVLLKELKKGRLGVLNCVIYSSSRYAIAKRRFNIVQIVENVKRRSAMMSPRNDHDGLLRKRRCAHLIRKRHEEEKQKLEEGKKPKSRKKRFRRMESVRGQLSELDCEPLRRKANSRLVRSLFREFTTEDPRLMPLEKLFDMSEEGDGTLDDVIPHEIHYVSPKVRLIPGTATERSAGHPVSTNCTAHSDCTENAVCVFSDEASNLTVRLGNCYCRPEFYRDDTMCRRIPSSNHREKRLERNARNDFVVPKHLFYKNSREILKSTPEPLEEDEYTESPKVLAFEEEESFLLSDCIDDRDCSMHANCVQPTNGHPYCKCRPGYRGNGIFCWEMMDYVPAEEQFLSDEEINTFDEPLEPGMSMAFQTVGPPEVEED